MTFVYREHAIQRMFERDIFEIDVENTIKNGEIIEEYIDDEPYPSFLVLGLTLNLFMLFLLKIMKKMKL